jgi:hypothetical protein
MKFLLRIVLCLFLVFIAPASAGVLQKEKAWEQGIWTKVLPGLSLARFNADFEAVKGVRRNMEHPGLIVLRIDPDTFRFRLLTASELESDNSRSLVQWGREYNLVAAINAGMFWSDQRTSTGYLRNYQHMNQGRIHPDYGGFLVFNPRSGDGVPRVQIVDRYHRSDWQSLLDKYASVVQSYRLIGRKGEIAWERRERRYTASCIAEDGEGRILFLHTRKPMSMRSFGRRLLDLPLGIDVCIFTEGGNHAGLYLKTPLLTRMWPGTAGTGFWSGGKMASVPNVIGVEPRKRSLQWPDFGIAPR